MTRQSLGPPAAGAVSAAPLVLVGHGTRAPRTAPLLERVAEQTSSLLGDVDVRYGWTEFQTPSAADALAGSADPVIVPFFLGGGYHVEHDLPRLVHEHGSGTLTAHLGPEPIIVEAVAERTRQALAREGVRAIEVDGVVLAAAGSRRHGPIAETEKAAEELARLLGVPVRPAYLSAGGPNVRRRVHAWHEEGAEVVIVAAYLLSEGRFSHALHHCGAELVSAPVGAHPAIADVVARRYHRAANSYRRGGRG